MVQNNEYDFLREQFRDIKDSQVRLEEKLDLLRDSVDLKVQIVSDKLQVHEQMLGKHGQIFSLASVIITTGLAGIGAVLAWIYQNFSSLMHK